MVKRNSGTSKEDICQNQFTAYVVLAVKRKRQAYIKKKIRDKENQAKREEEQSNFGAEENTVWDRLEVQNEELVAAVQQLKPKARFIVTGYVLKGKTFKELWCCTIKVDIENSKGQYIEKDKQEATKDGSESTKIQHGI